MSREARQTEQQKQILTLGEEWARAPGNAAWMAATGDLCQEFERLGFRAEDVHQLVQEQFAVSAGLGGDLEYAQENTPPTYDRAPGNFGGSVPHVLTQADLRAELVGMTLKADAKGETLDLGSEWSRREVAARWLRVTADLVKHMRGLGFTSDDVLKCVTGEFLTAAEQAGAFAAWVVANAPVKYEHGDRGDGWPSSREIAGIVKGLPR